MSSAPDTPGLRPLAARSSVLAVVTHFRYERWLGQCLESLVGQTRPPENIVVVDDASSEPPLEIVQQFPNVTLLSSSENVGMYRLVQQVMNDTRYDAYMFQDADDWSTPDRLRLQLEEAERSGAVMVGCQEDRFYEGVAPAAARTRHADCNAILLRNPKSRPILVGASLISGELVRNGGKLYTANFTHGRDEVKQTYTRNADSRPGGLGGAR